MQIVAMCNPLHVLYINSYMHVFLVCVRLAYFCNPGKCLQSCTHVRSCTHATAEDGYASTAAKVSRVTSAANRDSGKISTAGGAAVPAMQTAPFSIAPETLPSNAQMMCMESTIKDSEECHFSHQVTSNLKRNWDFLSFSSPFSGLASTVNERKNRQWNHHN